MEEFIIELAPEEEQLRQIIEPLLDSEGYELVRLRLKKAQAKSLLALYIDTKERKNGILMENLEDVSRLLSDVLDATNTDNNIILPGRYDLEVSSPGLDRPLCKRSHFKDAVYEKVKIRLKSPDESGMKNIVGRLSLVSEAGITIQPDNKDETTIAFADMAEAHTIFDFAKLEKHKNKSR